jgi:hypothetical protein
VPTTQLGTRSATPAAGRGLRAGLLDLHGGSQAAGSTDAGPAAAATVACLTTVRVLEFQRQNVFHTGCAPCKPQLQCPGVATVQDAQTVSIWVHGLQDEWRQRQQRRPWQDVSTSITHHQAALLRPSVRSHAHCCCCCCSGFGTFSVSPMSAHMRIAAAAAAAGAF